MKLTVDVHDNSRCLLLLCKGEIVQGDESEYLCNLITKRNGENVIVDLAAVTNVDEHGLIMFVLCHTLLSSSHRQVSFRNVPPPVLEAFRHRQLDSVFEVSNSAAA